jgi:hypothetical protein
MIYVLAFSALVRAEALLDCELRLLPLTCGDGVVDAVSASAGVTTVSAARFSCNGALFVIKLEVHWRAVMRIGIGRSAEKPMSMRICAVPARKKAA